MLRQRVHTRTNPFGFVGRLLVLVLALGLAWYGLMVLLLSVKLTPSTVEAISGYRTAYDFLAGLGPMDFTPRTRGILAAAGVAAFLSFGYLALRELPRPYLARADLALKVGERGDTTVNARAIERLAETAALRQPGVTRAASRYGSDELGVDVAVSTARELAAVLTAVQAAVAAALQEHDLPVLPVRVTLTGFDRKHKRELS
jgi:hypothetical protein